MITYLNECEREILRMAGHLLDDESRWAIVTAAQDKDKQEVGPASPSAVCWCLVGAIAVCSIIVRGKRGRDTRAMQAAKELLYSDDLIAYWVFSTRKQRYETAKRLQTC